MTLPLAWPSWGDWIAFGAIVLGIINRNKIANVHVMLNNRLDEWKSETHSRIEGAYAQGKVDEQKKTKG